MTLDDLRAKCSSKYKTPVIVNNRTCVMLNPQYNAELNQILKYTLRDKYSENDLVLCTNISSLAGYNIGDMLKEGYSYSFIVWVGSMSHLKWYNIKFKELNALTKTL